MRTNPLCVACATASPSSHTNQRVSIAHQESAKSQLGSVRFGRINFIRLLKRTDWLWCWALTGLLTAGPVHAQTSNQANGCGPLGDVSRFAPHRENFVLYNKMDNKGWAAQDEAAMRTQFSFKYSIYGCPLKQTKDLRWSSATSEKSEVYLSYTGLFDFYMGTRASSPVINRISNPGLHWRIPLGRHIAGDHRTSVEISWQHLSDGQVFEPTEPEGARAAQFAYERRDRYLFDTFSRGTDFIGLQARWTSELGGPQVDWQANARLYTQKDSAVTWGPLAGKGISIANYDLAKVQAGYNFKYLGVDQRLELAWRMGKSGLKHDSVDLSWYLLDQRKISLPIYVRVHFGPMNTLSNYTQRQDSIGIGLRFDNALL